MKNNTEELEILKTAIDEMLKADDILSQNGYCGVTHDSSYNRNYLQAVDYGLIKLIKRHNLPFALKMIDLHSYDLDLSCEELKTFAITTSKQVVEFKLVTKNKLRNMLKNKIED